MKSSSCSTVLFLTIYNVITLVNATTIGRVTDFDDYKPILQQTLNFRHKLRIIEAVWGEIRNDYANDLPKVDDLYQQLDYTIEAYLQMQIELQAAEELRQELRLHLVKKHGMLLAKSWGSKSTAYTPSEHVQTYLGALSKSFNTTLLFQIYKNAIDLCYDAIEPRFLAAHVRQTFIANDVKSYEAMIEAQIYLYWKYAHAGDESDTFLFEFAYYLHKIKSHYFFRHLSKRLERRFEKVVNDLPTTLGQLFLQSEFCLLNKQYDEFLYTTNGNDIDEERRFIFTWGEPKVVDLNGVWLLNITEISGPGLTLRFGFKSKQFGMFMYLESSVKDYKNIVAAWRSGKAPMHSDWSLTYKNDGLVIEYDKKLLCASEQFFDGRRFVFGRYDALNNPGTENCQWQATVCPERRRKS